MRNYVLEGELKQAAVEAGALETSLADWELDVQVFRITNRSEINAWVEKARQDFPHRFVIAGTEDHALSVEAFGPQRNLTKQAELVRKVGQDRAAQIAADFGTTLGGKPGTIPAHIKTNVVDGDAKRAATNPWSNHSDNIDERGRYSAKALARQGQCVRGVGETRAAQIAAAVGSKLGDVRPRQSQAA